MNIRRLQEFSVVAKTQSIKKAAEDLGISSATLSARLIKFEESLGTVLFLRKGNRMVLTEAGARLAGNSEEILSDLNSLKASLEAAQLHSYQSLKIAISGLNMPLFLGPLLDRLNLSYPDMRLELLDDQAYGLEEGLRSGKIDVYFTAGPREYEIPGLAKQPINVSNQYILLPGSHPLAMRNTISIQELSGETFILYPETKEPSLRKFQLQNLDASGIRFVLYDHAVSPVFYTLLVPIGKGVILLPSPIMDLPPNSVQVPVNDLPCPAVPCFFYDPASTNPEVQAFVKDYTNFSKEAIRRDHRAAL